MRPLNKGETPKIDDVQIQVDEYGKWRKHLIHRIGYYCAYCNIPLSHSLNVEHVVAKKPQGGNDAGDFLAWENMLLACGPCNTQKGNLPIDISKMYLPEYHNTLIPFDIQQDQNNPDAVIIVPSANLTPLQTKKAEATIKLVGLDQVDLREKVVDIRWKKRKAALLLAETSYTLYSKIKKQLPHEIETAAEHIARTAAETGFFLLWFKIFKDEQTVMQKLLDSNFIPGTSRECFDNIDYSLRKRNPKNVIDPI